MKLVKWGGYGPLWPSLLDDDNFLPSEWPELSSNKGLDIYETEDSVVIEAAVPGVPEDEVEVTIEGNVISISAEHDETEEEKSGKTRTYKSSRQTSFNYSTNIPRMVDATKADAEVENGVIKVVIPKTEEEKPKRIEVKKKK